MSAGVLHSAVRADHSTEVNFLGVVANDLGRRHQIPIMLVIKVICGNTDLMLWGIAAYCMSPIANVMNAGVLQSAAKADHTTNST